MKDDEKVGTNKDEPKLNKHFHPLFAEHYKQVHLMDRDERNKQINKDIEIMAGHATNSSSETQKVIADYIN